MPSSSISRLAKLKSLSRYCTQKSRFSKVPLQLVGHVEPFEHLLENVGHGNVLEDAALRLFGQHPERGHDFHAVLGEDFASLTLANAVADAVKVALLTVEQIQPDGDFLAQELVKSDIGLILRKQVEVKTEQARDRLLAGKSDEQEFIFAQRSRNLHGTILLGVIHNPLLLPVMRS